MRIAFADFIDWDYDADTPHVAPLGGAQSGLCYLAQAMAAGGHAAFLLTSTSRPGIKRGVDCRRLADLAADDVRALDLDALVCLNVPAAHALCREMAGERARVLLWCQHDSDQPAIRPLADPQVRGGWDGIACLTAYHRDRFVADLGVDPARVAILGNAIGPAFEALFPANASIAAVKSLPTLAYTSTPFRGLKVLLAAFPHIRARVPGARLKVFSSLQVYFLAGAEDSYRHLYDRCRATKGVDYIGSVPQPELARQLAGVRVLAYPNTFPETQCIAAMEAMAAGARVVTSALGALPETTAGFATCIALDPPEAYLPAFVAATVAALAEPPDEAALAMQRAYLLDRHTWRRRAAEWQAWIAGHTGLAPPASGA